MKKVIALLLGVCLIMSSLVVLTGGSVSAEERGIKVKLYRGSEWLDYNELEDNLGPRIEGYLDTGDNVAIYYIWPLLQALVFEYTHPDIRLVGRSSEPRTTEELFAQIAGGTAASFFGVGPEKILSFVDQGLLVDVTDFSKGLEPYKEVPSSVFEQVSIGGKIYALPSRYVYLNGISYRKDYFRDAGIFNKEGEPAPPENWTLTDFTSLAQKLTNPKKEIWGYQAYGENEFREFYGEPLVMPDKSGKYTWEAAFNIPEAMRSWEFVKDLMWNKKCLLVNDAYRAHIQNWFTGRVAMDTWMCYATGWYYKETTEFGPDFDVRKNLGIAPLPSGPEKIMGKGMRNTYYAINAVQTKEEIEATKEWIRWNLNGLTPEMYARLALWQRPVEGKERAGNDLIECRTVLFPPLWSYPKIEGIPWWRDALPEEYISAMDTAMAVPLLPSAMSYGVPFPESDVTDVLKPVFEAVVTDPKCDIEKELNRAAELANNTILNYRDENATMEKLKSYYTAIGDFYKENYPDYYNKWFELLKEKYYKVW